MFKPKVFLTRRLLPSGMSIIEAFCQTDVWPDEVQPPYEEILRRVKGMEGLVCLLTDRIDREVLDAAGSHLKVISAYSVGVDNIDLAAATERGIPVGNTPGVLTDATADLAFALLLAAARRVVEADRSVKKGEWKTWGPAILLGADLRGSTLGVLGFGRIGRAVARRATGFGMRILFHEPGKTAPEPGVEATQVDLNTLLSQSDFITVHTPLTPETKGLINASALAKMKPTAILVNTSRGPVVNQTALYDALKTKRIFAAALDVTDPEPLPADSPLLTLENCIVVPHIASASVQTREKMSQMAAENLIAGLKGERLPNCVNPDVYR